MAEHSQPTSGQNGQDRKNLVRAWLTQDDWQIEEVSDPNALWMFRIRHLSGASPVLTVFQPTNVPDGLHIMGGINIDGETQRHFYGMESRVRQDILWELRFGLLRLGVDFQGADEPLGTVRAFRRVFDDALTKDTLLHRIGEVINAVTFIMWLFQRRVVEPAQDADSDTVH